MVGLQLCCLGCRISTSLLLGCWHRSVTLLLCGWSATSLPGGEVDLPLFFWSTVSICHLAALLVGLVCHLAVLMVGLMYYRATLVDLATWCFAAGVGPGTPRVDSTSGHTAQWYQICFTCGGAGFKSQRVFEERAGSCWPPPPGSTRYHMPTHISTHRHTFT